MRAARVAIAGAVVVAGAVLAWCGWRSAGRGARDESHAPTPGSGGDGSTTSGAAEGRSDAALARRAAAPPADADANGVDGGADPHGPAIITRRVLLLSETLRALVSECYDVAVAQRPGLTGRIRMTVALRRTEERGNLIHEVEVDDAASSLRDPGFRECATENIFAAEELLEQFQAAGDPTGNRLVETIDLTFPRAAAPADAWPAADTSPVCGPGQRLRGDRPPAGERQWCEDAQGRKQGDEYLWGPGGEVDAILRYVDGRSNTMKMRPLDQAERADAGT